MYKVVKLMWNIDKKGEKNARKADNENGMKISKVLAKTCIREEGCKEMSLSHKKTMIDN